MELISIANHYGNYYIKNDLPHYAKCLEIDLDEYKVLVSVIPRINGENIFCQGKINKLEEKIYISDVIPERQNLIIIRFIPIIDLPEKIFILYKIDFDLMKCIGEGLNYSYSLSGSGIIRTNLTFELGNNKYLENQLKKEEKNYVYFKSNYTKGIKNLITREKSLQYLDEMYKKRKELLLEEAQIVKIEKLEPSLTISNLMTYYSL